MAGLRLADMEASDMVDVVHYFFESDLTSDNPEYADAKSDVRAMIYGTLYGERYKYGSETRASRTVRTSGGWSPEDVPTAFDPTNPPSVRKPYVPPTDFDADSPIPFGGLLDAPMA